jgi:hypothetical protein
MYNTQIHIPKYFPILHQVKHASWTFIQRNTSIQWTLLFKYEYTDPTSSLSLSLDLNSSDNSIPSHMIRTPVTKRKWDRSDLLHPPWQIMEPVIHVISRWLNAMVILKLVIYISAIQKELLFFSLAYYDSFMLILPCSASDLNQTTSLLELYVRSLNQPSQIQLFHMVSFKT